MEMGGEEMAYTKLMRVKRSKNGPFQGQQWPHKGYSWNSKHPLALYKLYPLLPLPYLWLTQTASNFTCNWHNPLFHNYFSIHLNQIQSPWRWR